MDTSILSWALSAGGFALAAAGAVELRRRREMVARACHELRGPLTAVRLSLATMERRREAPPERLATLDHELRRAGLALDDFAAARSGRRIVDREAPVEVAELLEEQFHSWAAVGAAFDSVVVLGQLLPGAMVVGDRLRLAQAISNLVAIALEHGPGRIELTARVVQPRHVRIEVIDEGPGLPAPLARLTRRARGGRGRGGRGRGLAIAAQIAERHRGRLVAAPTGHGTRIGIELTLVQRGRS
jgi:signal transduction histidine kinase